MAQKHFFIQCGIQCEIFCKEHSKTLSFPKTWILSFLLGRKKHQKTKQNKTKQKYFQEKKKWEKGHQSEKSVTLQG